MRGARIPIRDTSAARSTPRSAGAYAPIRAAATSKTSIDGCPLNSAPNAQLRLSSRSPRWPESASEAQAVSEMPFACPVAQQRMPRESFMARLDDRITIERSPVELVGLDLHRNDARVIASVAGRCGR
jgi:hypothetical protein